MTEEGEPEFQYCVFDYVSDDLKKPYEERCEDLSAWYKAQTNPGIVELLLPQLVNSLTEFKQLEEQYIQQGYEGIILRSVGGPYKCNRSTLKEGYLLKLKRFLDSEAIIKGYEEKLHNDNIKETSELGLSKRSTKKANLRGADTLGALVVTDIKTGLTFSVGSGFDDNMRKEIWSNQTRYVNKIVKYKYQPSGGKALPRFPVFLGFRSAIDM
jgi:DNA ligase-1